MNKRIFYFLIALAVLFFATSLFIFIKSNKETQKTSTAPIARDKTDKEIQESAVLKIRPFFFAERTRYMLPVEKEIPFSIIKEDNYRRFLDILIEGEENFITPIPEGVEVRTLYWVERQNLLIIDFTEDLILKFPSGTAAELEFIHFVVNNICYNFKEIKKVKFLVSGNEIQTLSGHISMDQPFFPNFRYLKTN